MAFHETVRTRLQDAGVDKAELDSMDSEVEELGSAMGSCDARRLLAAFTRVNRKVDFVLEKAPEGSKNDLLKFPHIRVFRNYVGLKVDLYKEVEQGMKNCSGQWVESSFALPDTEELTADEATTILEGITAAETPSPAEAPKTTTSPTTGVTKPKRAPSSYNIFIGECLRKPEKGGRGLNMTECSAEWKLLTPEQKASRVEAIKQGGGIPR